MEEKELIAVEIPYPSEYRQMVVKFTTETEIHFIDSKGKFVLAPLNRLREYRKWLPRGNVYVVFYDTFEDKLYPIDMLSFNEYNDSERIPYLERLDRLITTLSQCTSQHIVKPNYRFIDKTTEIWDEFYWSGAVVLNKESNDVVSIEHYTSAEIEYEQDNEDLDEYIEQELEESEYYD